MSKASQDVVAFLRAAHTYLTMFGLLAVSFFAVTGVMLNHAQWFGILDVRTSTAKGSLPLGIVQPPNQPAIEQTLREKFDVSGRVEGFENLGTQTIVNFEQPGRRSQAIIATSDGSVEVTTESRGLTGAMTDLHRGASAGRWWKVFIDATAAILVLAFLTGAIVWFSLPQRRLWGAVALLAGIGLWVGAYLLLAIR